MRRGAGAVVALALLTGSAATSAMPPNTTSAAAATSALVPVGPTRLADTRQDDCGCHRVDPSTIPSASPSTPTYRTKRSRRCSRAPGSFDVVVVKAGYNDWSSDFPAEFDAVVRAARAKGAHTIVWLSYNEAVPRSNARRAYEENNADLRWLVTRPEYTDVLLADWLRYSGPRPDRFADGTHGTPSGTWALADDISRWVAAVEHRPCPRPWSLGWATPDPCPPPEIVGPVPDPRSLY